MIGPDQHVPEARIDAWLDGELSSSESSALDEHTQGCPSCRDRAERAQALRSLLDLDATDSARVDPTADAQVDPIRPMWPRVRDRLHNRTGGGLAAIFRPAFTVATSAATVVGVVIGLLLGSIDQPIDAAEEESLWSTLESTLWETEEGTSLSDFYEISDGVEGEEGS